jgi:DNA repair exonuclease SbcCD ATPase subunit
MSDLFKSAESVRKMLRGFKAIEEVAEAMEAVAVLEQRRVEAERVLPGLQEQRDTLVAQAESAKQALNDTQVAINNAQAEAVATVAAIKREATDASATLVAEAQAQARDIVLAAEARVTEAEEKLVAVTRTKAELEQDCAELEKKMGKLRAQAEKLLGSTA